MASSSAEADSEDQRFEEIALKLLKSLDEAYESLYGAEFFTSVFLKPVTYPTSNCRASARRAVAEETQPKNESGKKSKTNTVPFGNQLASALRVLLQYCATRSLEAFLRDLTKLLNDQKLFSNILCQYVLENVLKRLLLLRQRRVQGFASSTAGAELETFVGVSVLGSRGPSESSIIFMECNDSSRRLLESCTVEEFRQEETVVELLNELESADSQIAQQSSEHIHSEEVVLTCGYSPLIMHFLLEAGKKRRFKVFVSEAAPECSGHRLASELAGRGIDTTLITDAAVYAIMARVHKLIIRAEVVLAEGSVITRPTCRLAADAARAHAVPVLVLTELHRISERFPHDISAIEKSFVPSTLLPYESISPFQSRVGVSNPRYAIVPSSQVSIFVTDIGSFSSNFAYYLLRELYGARNHDGLG
jgi:translation initiation factor 2B subunit (eIF-2B alpha/beta/delta family)